MSSKIDVSKYMAPKPVMATRARYRQHAEKDAVFDASYHTKKEDHDADYRKSQVFSFPSFPSLTLKLSEWAASR